MSLLLGGRFDGTLAWAGVLQVILITMILNKITIMTMTMTNFLTMVMMAMVTMAMREVMQVLQEVGSK